MSEPDPLVSWVIVAFHRAASLDALLGGVGSHPELEVIVVDVESDAEVGAVIDRHGARRLPTTDNPGFATCVNRGAALVSAPVVVFGNDDLTTTWDDLQALVAPLVDGSFDVAVPQIRDAEGQVELTIVALPTVGALAKEWMLLPDRPIGALRRLDVQKWRAPQVAEAVTSATAAMVAVRSAVLAATPLPEAYFLYWEEQEWFWRLRQLGLRVTYRPEAQAAHAGGRDDVRPQKSALMARNVVRCVRRTQGRGSAALALPVVIAWNLRLLVVDAIRSARGGSRSDRAPARWAGLRASLAAWREVR